MKIRCSKEELLKGITLAQSAISSKSTLPILSHFLLETQDKRLKITATDLELGIRCFLKAEILAEGGVTISAKRFSDIVRELPEGKDIEIRLGDKHAVGITCDKSRFQVLGLAKEDFPIVPDFDEKKSFVLPKSVLQEMVKKTVFAVSQDQTRHTLNGVYFMAEENSIKMVATDGLRLAYVTSNGLKNLEKSSAIIPSKVIQELLKVISAAGPEETVKMSVTENQVAFKTKDITLISRLIDGNYPNWQQVIPKNHTVSLELDTDAFLSVTRRAALCTQDKGGSVRYALSAGKLQVKASAQGLMEFEDELDVSYSGSPMDIAFNPNFIIDVLKNVGTDKVTLNLGGSLNPGVISPKENSNYLYVVMPVRLS